MPLMSSPMSVLPMSPFGLMTRGAGAGASSSGSQMLRQQQQQQPHGAGGGRSRSAFAVAAATAPGLGLGRDASSDALGASGGAAAHAPGDAASLPLPVVPTEVPLPCSLVTVVMPTAMLMCIAGEVDTMTKALPPAPLRVDWVGTYGLQPVIALRPKSQPLGFGGLGDQAPVLSDLGVFGANEADDISAI
jgi:hypothetical protein